MTSGGTARNNYETPRRELSGSTKLRNELNSSIRVGLRLGIKWLYQPQPDATAAVAVAGITFTGWLPRLVSEIRICPVGFQHLPQIIFETAWLTIRKSPDSSLLSIKHCWTKENLETLINLVQRAGGRIERIYEGEGFERVFFVLAEAADDSLIRATQNSLVKCDAHGCYNCLEANAKYQELRRRLEVPAGWT